jgi:hypothetical protein
MRKGQVMMATSRSEIMVTYCTLLPLTVIRRTDWIAYSSD